MTAAPRHAATPAVQKMSTTPQHTAATAVQQMSSALRPTVTPGIQSMSATSGYMTVPTVKQKNQNSELNNKRKIGDTFGKNRNGEKELIMTEP